MTLPENGCLLRILIGESDRHEGRPLCEWIVLKAREQGLAGATAWRGTMGFGANSRIHTAKILLLSTDLPMIIEIVDTQTKLETFLDLISPALQGGLATLEKAVVRFYRSKEK